MAAVRAVFEENRPAAEALAAAFVDGAEVAGVVEEASQRFDALLPEMGYVDRPDHPMASSVFHCSAFLALWQVLAERGVDVHDFGRTMLEQFRAVLATEDGRRRAARDDADGEASRAAWVASAEVSQRERRPGEFVYELVPGTSRASWGMNVLSCAICHQYAAHGAMDLVPYMCATDDVVSDAFGQGLRRTGTIALGRHACDFRYGPDQEPLPVAEQYPARIRVTPAP